MGAALGYLLSQKNLEKTQEAEQQTPPSAPSAEATVPTWSAPVSEPLFDALAPAAAAPPVLAPATPAPPAFTPAEPEIILTRNFLEEPLPGSGWTPSAPAAIEDATIETEAPSGEATIESVLLDEVMEVPLVEEVAVIPAAEAPVVQAPMAEVSMPEMGPADVGVIEERPPQAMGPGTAGTEALAQAATVAGSIPLVEVPFAEDSSRVDDLKSRIEETRRRIRHELEQPFESSPFGIAPEGDWTMAPIVPVAETVEQMEVEPAIIESPTMETVEVETLAVESVSAEPVEQAMPAVSEPQAPEPPLVAGTPVMETVTPGPPVMETPVSLPVVEEQPLTPEPLVMDTVTPGPPVMETVTPGPPVMEMPLAQPVVEEQVPVDVPLDLETTVSDADATAEAALEPEEPVDYDSMKSRIESTRSRLKAKAFDAMMSGESALLGRELDGAKADGGQVARVDDEVDETIETSLREEEE